MILKVKLCARGFLLCASVLLVTMATGAKTKKPFGSARNLRRDEAIQGRNLEDYPRQYVLLKSEEIKNRVLEWKSLYSNLVRITTSQEAYGLPRSGGASDCPFDEGADGCLNYIVTIQDFVAHPEGSDSSNHLPEVFWSGCVHGKAPLQRC